MPLLLLILVFLCSDHSLKIYTVVQQKKTTTNNNDNNSNKRKNKTEQNIHDSMVVCDVQVVGMRCRKIGGIQWNPSIMDTIGTNSVVLV